MKKKHSMKSTGLRPKTPVVYAVGLTIVIVAAAVVLGMHLFMPTNVNGSRELAYRKACQMNLVSLGKALETYRVVHGDYPLTLSTLVSENAIPQEMLTCPMRKDTRPGLCDYCYLPPKSSSASDGIVLYEREPWHMGGRNVLRVDGKVDWLEDRDFHRELGKYRGTP